MAEFVYVGCAVTSLLCALLLFRGYARDHVRLIFWCAICFSGFALNNILVFLDIVLIPEVNLIAWRLLPALAGVGALLYGFIWDSAG